MLNYSQKGNSIERQVQKGKKVSCRFGQVNFIFFLYSCLFGFAFFGQLPFWQRQLPFWFSIFAFLALIRADWYDILWYEICLSGSKKNRLVRDSSGSYKSRFSRQQVREVLVGFKKPTFKPTFF